MQQTRHSHIAQAYKRLCDYIHENEITQLVGEGASSSPFTRIIRQAYKQRYGAQARPLRVVNLGLYSNLLKHNKEPEVIHEIQRRLKLEHKNTLVLSEYTFKGVNLRSVKRVVARLGIPVKTATLSNYSATDFDFNADIDPAVANTYLGKGDLFTYSKRLNSGKIVSDAKTQVTLENLDALIPRLKVNEYAAHKSKLAPFLDALKHVRKVEEKSSE